MRRFLASAAVSDYRPEEAAQQKVKKGEGQQLLTLVRTPDVLMEASRKVSEVLALYTHREAPAGACPRSGSRKKTLPRPTKRQCKSGQPR